MVIFDLIATVLQVILLGYSLKNCLQEEKNTKVILVMLLTFILSADITNELGIIHNEYRISSNGLILMIIISLIYRKQIKKSLTVYSIVNIIISLFIIISSNLILACARLFIPEEYDNYALISIVYIPQILMTLFFIKNINIIQSIYKFIVGEKMEMAMIIICNLLIFIVLFYRLTFGEYSQMVINLLEILFATGLIYLVFYFQNIHSKSKKIFALNEALESKNNELRKIKHDYGAQISYLYGLALMDRYDDIKKSLKNIINVNQNTADAVEIKMSKEKKDKSILEMALKTATDKGIHVILEEEYDIKSIRIDEMELYRIVSNIINNAIKAMNGQGIIIVKAYELMNKVIIELQNNGPKIPDEDIESIFKAGFTTKKNDDMSHGYGLSIVKELVEKNNGKITVKSTEEKTSFKICFNMI